MRKLLALLPDLQGVAGVACLAAGAGLVFGAGVALLVVGAALLVGAWMDRA